MLTRLKQIGDYPFIRWAWRILLLVIRFVLSLPVILIILDRIVFPHWNLSSHLPSLLMDRMVILASVVLSIVWWVEAWVRIMLSRRNEEEIRDQLTKYTDLQKSEMDSWIHLEAELNKKIELLQSLIDASFESDKDTFIYVDTFRRSKGRATYDDLLRNIQKNLIKDLRIALGSQGAIGTVRVSLIKADLESGAMYLVCRSGLQGHSREGQKLRISVNESLAGLALEQKGSYWSNDVSKNPGLRYQSSKSRGSKLMSIWCEPINDKDTPDHVISITSDHVNAFEERHANLISWYATKSALVSVAFRRG